MFSTKRLFGPAGLLLMAVAVFWGCNDTTEPNTPPSTPTITASDTIVDGGSSINLSCKASDPDNDPVSYIWHATGGYFDKTNARDVVWTSPIATVQEKYTISAEVRDSQGAGASSSITVTVNAASGRVVGTAWDENGLAIEGMHVSAGNNETRTDADGHYSLALTPGSYEIYAEAVTGNRYLSDRDTTAVSVGQVVTVDLNAREGYYLALSKISFNQSGDSVTVSSGSSVTLNFDYSIWSRIGCPSCIDFIAVGIEADGQDAQIAGMPGGYPGRSGSSGSLVLTAPQATGVYTVYALVAPGLTVADAIQKYELDFLKEYRYIPIGTINVQ